jgi:hypothetical protein
VSGNSALRCMSGSRAPRCMSDGSALFCMSDGRVLSVRAALVCFKGGLLVGRTDLAQFGAPHGLLEEEVSPMRRFPLSIDPSGM